MAGETFKLVTPHMRGEAVRLFQAVLNQRFKSWNVNYKIPVNGDYDMRTRDAARTVAHAMGLNPNSYRDGFTPAVRIKMRHPERRTPTEQKRFEQRKEWRGRLRKRMAASNGGPQLAIKYGRKHVGTKENPFGSNRGPMIDKWNRAVHLDPGPNAFWCGSFVNACMHAGGFPNQDFIRFCPSIETRARSGADGWSWHPDIKDGKPGDLVLYTAGSAEAAHVELLARLLPAPNRLNVIGGNTSATPGSGNQSNGGCVAEHKRNPNVASLRFKGYARPPWKR